MGQVCAKHTQYYEERCPYCEEPEACETAHPRLHASERGGVCLRCNGDMFPTLKPVGLNMLIPDPATYGGIMNLPGDYALSPQAKARQYDERLLRAMLPPNDGHGAFE